MTPVRAPDTVRGDVPGLLCRGMPIFVLRQTPEDDEAEPCDGERLHPAEQAVVTDHGDDAGWLVAAGRTVDPCGPNWSQLHAADVAIDWSDRASIYLCLAWLADRGHVCLWMLPSTHGGGVDAHGGLTAWEVSAILVARSVGRVARGLGAVKDLVYNVTWGSAGCVPGITRYMLTSRVDKGSRHHADVGRYYKKGPVVDERPAMFAKALADGCALLDPSGILLPD